MTQVECFDAEYASLHVRKGNRAAFGLYHHTLQFEYVSSVLCGYVVQQ
jgi:ribosomal protein S18 acetylase RimI-like enzyme